MKSCNYNSIFWINIISRGQFLAKVNPRKELLQMKKFMMFILGIGLVFTIVYIALIISFYNILSKL